MHQPCTPVKVTVVHHVLVVSLLPSVRPLGVQSVGLHRAVQDPEVAVHVPGLCMRQYGCRGVFQTHRVGT